MAIDSQMIPGYIPSVARVEGAAMVFVVRNEQLLVRERDNGVEIPHADDLLAIGVTPAAYHFIGAIGSVSCYAVRSPDPLPTTNSFQICGLRSLFGVLGDTLYHAAGRAMQILQWDDAHERARHCPRCSLISYPRISPAVIVAVTDAERILLARAKNFPLPFYSVLAGFVEIGETLEMCIHREVMEEVGIQVKNLKYFESQPWPFTSSLMVGFTAAYAGGAIKIDNNEIMDAAWFSVDALPALPGSLSIARRLIDDFIRQQRQ
jgi:NAD+ diphosphatase